MRDLTKEERDMLLAKYPEAKSIAVNNFLSTCGANDTEHNACLNLNMDARSYRWNPDTVKAISEGIKLAALPLVNEKRLTPAQLKDILSEYLEFISAVFDEDRTTDSLRQIEKAFIVARTMGLLGVKFSELNDDSYPPIVIQCWMAGRPLTSVFRAGEEEKARLSGNNG